MCFRPTTCPLARFTPFLSESPQAAPVTISALGGYQSCSSPKSTLPQKKSSRCTTTASSATRPRLHSLQPARKGEHEFSTDAAAALEYLEGWLKRGRFSIPHRSRRSADPTDNLSFRQNNTDLALRFGGGATGLANLSSFGPCQAWKRG